MGAVLVVVDLGGATSRGERGDASSPLPLPLFVAAFAAVSSAPPSRAGGLSVIAKKSGEKRSERPQRETFRTPLPVAVKFLARKYFFSLLFSSFGRFFPS